MSEPKKLAYVRWAHPVWVDGLGMVDSVDLRPDAETGVAKQAGVLASWLPELRVVRVTTKAGETWVNASCSIKPAFEDRASTAKSKK